MKSKGEFTPIPGGIPNPTPEGGFGARKEELKLLENGYDCEVNEMPRWCVYGKDQHGGSEKVIYWIRPTSNDEFVAHKMAYLLSHTGGIAKAYMTEWNQNLKEEPVYEKKAL